MIKVLESRSRKYFYTNKTIYKKPTINIILYQEKYKAIPLKSGKRQGNPITVPFFNTVLKALVGTIQLKRKLRE